MHNKSDIKSKNVSLPANSQIIQNVKSDYYEVTLRMLCAARFGPLDENAAM